MGELKTRRIVLLGKTGAGKSSLANTIFGEKLFKVLPGFESVTSDCEAETNGRKITLIDTPGFFDTKRPEKELKQVIVRCITKCSPGPHAFLIVLKLERFTKLEKAVIHRMTQYFSEDVYKYGTVVFTHGDELPEGETIKDFVKQNKSLSDIIKKCGGRCHVIDNKLWNNDSEDKYRSNEYQVEEILQSIEKTVEANNGECYTNEMLQKIERIIQQQEKMIRKTSENMSEEEIRKEAKNRVNKLLIKATGITVGALLGALCGLALPVALVTAGLAGVMKLAIREVGVKITAGTAAGVTAGAAGTAAGVTAGAAAEAGAAGVAGATGAAVVAAEAGAAAGAAGVAAEAGAAAGAAGVAAEAGAAGAAGGAMGAGLVAGVAVAGVLAAVGAGFGGFEGHQAAQTAETKQEAAEMAAKAVCYKGLKLIEDAYNLASQVNKEVKYTPLEEKDSKCKTPH